MYNFLLINIYYYYYITSIHAEIEDNERLRRELVDLENKIKQQTKTPDPISSR